MTSFRQGAGILTVFEAEAFVKALTPLSIQQIGSDKWMSQHEFTEKLNIQAHHNALSRHDEFVVEAISNYDKMNMLVEDLLVTELFREKVFPLIAPKVNNFTSMKAYICIYHEATLCNLLEVLLYHQSALEGCEDAVMELLDYCYRRLIQLNALGGNKSYSSADADSDSDSDSDSDEGEKDSKRKKKLAAAKAQKLALKRKKKMEKMVDQTPQESLARQLKDIQFNTACASVGMIRFLTEHIQHLPLSLMVRMLDTHDLILSLVPLIENAPWTRKKRVKGGIQLEKFIDNKWQPVSHEDRHRLTKLEGQVWLCLYNLLMEETCRKRYNFNTVRKEAIMRLKPHFNEVLIDQIPMLGELRRFVEEMALVAPADPTASTMAVIDAAPQIREKILASVFGPGLNGIDVFSDAFLIREETKTPEAGGPKKAKLSRKETEAKTWRELAEKLMKTVFADNKKNRERDLKRMSSTYNLDLFDEVLEDPKCTVCGEPALKRCSKCHLEWYCGRKCQVKAWKAYHKEMCNALCANGGGVQENKSENAKNVSQANELVAKLLAAEAKKRDGAEKTVLSSSSSPTQAKSVGKKSKRIVIEEMD